MVTISSEDFDAAGGLSLWPEDVNPHSTESMPSVSLLAGSLTACANASLGLGVHCGSQAARISRCIPRKFNDARMIKGALLADPTSSILAPSMILGEMSCTSGQGALVPGTYEADSRRNGGNGEGGTPQRPSKPQSPPQGPIT